MFSKATSLKHFCDIFTLSQDFIRLVFEKENYRPATGVLLNQFFKKKIKKMDLESFCSRIVQLAIFYVILKL